jgi:2-oxoglutarate ferredoxin oxidoreductase subunit delta
MAPQVVRDVVLIDRERCTGCGACIEICPVGGLGFDDRANSRGAQPVRFLGSACRADGLCVDSCPEPGAIVLAGSETSGRS